MDELRLAQPWLLLLLLAPLILLFWRQARGGVAFGGFALAAELRRSRGPQLYRLLSSLGLAALILAAARPQYGRSVETTDRKGRDLVLVLDLSLSMIADDIQTPTGERLHRLDAVCAAAREFIDGRPADRIGLVFFSEQALLGCPLTFDHETVKQFLEATRERLWDSWREGMRSMRRFGNQQRSIGLLGDATNLGLGLGEALTTLVGESSEGRAIILITDGRDTPPEHLNNWVDPVRAAQHAKSQDVRVYAIGVGNPDGTWSDPDMLFNHGVRQTQRVPRNMLPDMNRLSEIVQAGDGMLLRASDLSELRQIFARIDTLEPTSFEVRTVDHYSDRFHFPLAIGFLLLLFCLACEPRLRGLP